ncbi:phage terminase large subunit [Neptunomonas phycophila]|uniref:phage terminase large subunit n=1 Tax=Neptunomonas phycophila TaxID=1572645 RepID=UPI0026E28EC8|nr:phage terminase large subunit [Neptunomonas phycophila]MDO6466794.1 phage terminase large subunit [Neptunomonas phycophila]
MTDLLTTTQLNELLPYLTKQERVEIEQILSSRDLIKPQLSFPDWLPQATPAFTWNWKYQQFIQNEVINILDGLNDRLILSVPPRHGKSEMVTVRLPAYVLEYNPSFRWIIGAYSQTLANKFSRKTRRVAESRGVDISNERRAVDDWETRKDGGYRAAGVGAGVTGMGANGIIVDDPVKNRKEANSQTYRENVYDWYKDDLYTRMEPGGFLILIMTRWHEDDLAGRLIREEGTKEEGGEWKVINLPALADNPNDPLQRSIGQALCPERYDENALARIKRVLGDSFYALFQGNPVPAEGNSFLRSWFGRFGVAPGPERRIMVVQSWDTAYKPGQENDPSVCTTWIVTRLAYYLVDVWRDRVNYPDLKRTFKSKASQWNPDAILVEDKASGQSLIQDIREESGAYPVVAIEPEGDKLTRALAQSALVQSGLVMLPESAPWLADFEAEVTSFPLAANDDQVDSMTQFLKWVRRHGGMFEFASAGKREVASIFEHEVDELDTDYGFGRLRSDNDTRGY